MSAFVKAKEREIDDEAKRLRRWFKAERRNPYRKIQDPIFHENSKVARLLLPPERAAFTFGRHVFCRGEAWCLLRRHEGQHSNEMQVVGALRYVLAYRVLFKLGRYEDHPLETRARTAERFCPRCLNPDRPFGRSELCVACLDLQNRPFCESSEGKREGQTENDCQQSEKSPRSELGPE